MTHYSPERKEAVIQKMMPPMNMAFAVLSEETGINQSTLYNWRKQTKNKGVAVPGDGKNAERWSSADKFAIVLEAYKSNKHYIYPCMKLNITYSHRIFQ